MADAVGLVDGGNSISLSAADAAHSSTPSATRKTTNFQAPESPEGQDKLKTRTVAAFFKSFDIDEFVELLHRRARLFGDPRTVQQVVPGPGEHACSLWKAPLPSR